MIAPAIRRMAAGILLAASSLAWAADTATWTLKQGAPGEVTATGPFPKAQRVRSEDFLLRLSDQHEIRASTVATAARETWLVLCIDYSGSMAQSFAGMRNAVEQAVRGALSDSGAGLRIRTVPFASRVLPSGDFSSEPEAIVASFGVLAPERMSDSTSRLYDAIATGLLQLKEAPGTAARRLVVVSDGKDEGSASQPEVVARDALGLDVALDTIAYGRVTDASSANLQSLARATGGEFAKAGDPAGLAQAIGALLGKRPAPMAVVRFRYPPAADRLPVKAATLMFAPAGAKPVTLPVRLDAAIAAPAPANGMFPWRHFGLALAVLVLALVALSAWLVKRKRGLGPESTRQDGVRTNTQVDAAGAGHPRGRPRTMISPSFAAPRQGQPAAFLICVDGPRQGYRFPIEKDVIQLGAAAANDLVVPGDEHVSGHHASIRYDAHNLYLQDQRSLNGTYLNNQRLDSTARALAPGDQIRVGATTLELRAA